MDDRPLLDRVTPRRVASLLAGGAAATAVLFGVEVVEPGATTQQPASFAAFSVVLAVLAAAVAAGRVRPFTAAAVTWGGALAFAASGLLLVDRGGSTEVANLVTGFVFLAVAAYASFPLRVARAAAGLAIVLVLGLPAARDVVALSSILPTAVNLAVIVLLVDALVTVGIDHRGRASRHRDEAWTDPLTGLGSRRAGQRGLERAGAGTAVMLLDLDHFKRINDVYGHARGDEVLRLVGARIAATVRAGETAARWGGEEFLIVASDEDGGDVAALAERLRVEVGGLGPGVSGSIGWAVVRRGEVGIDALRRADQALYAAKSTGRDRVVRAAPPEAARPASRVDQAPRRAG